MNTVSRDFRQKLPKLILNIAFATAFVAIGALSSVIFARVDESVSFYSWLVLTCVGVVFLVRLLSDILTIGDNALELLLGRLGIQQQWSKNRMAKDLMWIIATILATTAIFPFIVTLGTLGFALQSITILVAIGIIFLFVYDIAHTFYRIVQEKASAIATQLEHESIEYKPSQSKADNESGLSNISKSPFYERKSALRTSFLGGIPYSEMLPLRANIDGGEIFDISDR